MLHEYIGTPTDLCSLRTQDNGLASLYDLKRETERVLVFRQCILRTCRWGERLILSLHDDFEVIKVD